MRYFAASLLMRLLLAGLLGLSMAQALASDKKEANRIVAEAIHTFEAFVADPHMERFLDQVVNAKAILIIPMLGKVGLIFGGAGGIGVGLLHDEQTNTWSPPAFYTLASLSVGLQAGGEVAQVVLVAMTHKGRYALLRNKFQVGADVSVAAGLEGVGAQAATTDIVLFSRGKGLYGGLTLEGAVIAVRNDLNEAFYGAPVSTVDILIKRSVSRPRATRLIEAVSEIAR
jgi:lipid-binding SYLF domain-containing protein